MVMFMVLWPMSSCFTTTKDRDRSGQKDGFFEEV
jgi:hypothetical protein